MQRLRPIYTTARFSDYASTLAQTSETPPVRRTLTTNRLKRRSRKAYLRHRQAAGANLTSLFRPHCAEQFGADTYQRCPYALELSSRRTLDGNAVYDGLGVGVSHTRDGGLVAAMLLAMFFTPLAAACIYFAGRINRSSVAASEAGRLFSLGSWHW